MFGRLWAKGQTKSRLRAAFWGRSGQLNNAVLIRVGGRCRSFEWAVVPPG